MDLKSLGLAALHGARDAKVEIVKEDGPDSNFHPTFVAYRGDEQVALVQMGGDIDSMRLRRLTGIIGRGFRATAMSVVYEGWTVGSDTPHGAINPDTGREWGEVAGSMSEYVAKHGRDGVVNEGFTIHAVTRDKAVHGMQTFQPTETSFGWTVRFDEESWTDDSEWPQVEGLMVDACRDALAGDLDEVTEATRVAGHAEGLTDVQIDADFDCFVALGILKEQLGIVGLFCREDDRDRFKRIAKLMGRAPSRTLDEAYKAAQARWN